MHPGCSARWAEGFCVYYCSPGCSLFRPSVARSLSPSLTCPLASLPHSLARSLSLSLTRSIGGWVRVGFRPLRLEKWVSGAVIGEARSLCARAPSLALHPEHWHDARGDGARREASRATLACTTDRWTRTQHLGGMNEGPTGVGVARGLQLDEVRDLGEKRGYRAPVLLLSSRRQAAATLAPW